MLVPRQQYSRELKVAAMREIDSGKGIAEVARMYQLSPKRLETWKGEWRAKGELAFPGKSARPQTRLDAERIAELERKVGQQAMEIDFLKSLAAFQGASPTTRRQWRCRIYQQIGEAAEAEAGVNRLCQIAGLSRAGYYRFRRRHESKPAAMNLRNEMLHIALCWPAYGYRRVHAELVRQGWKVNHKRILRLMRADNLLCVRRRKFILTTDSRHGLPIYPNLVEGMMLSSGWPISLTSVCKWNSSIWQFCWTLFPAAVLAGLCSEL